MTYPAWTSPPPAAAAASRAMRAGRPRRQGDDGRDGDYRAHDRARVRAVGYLAQEREHEQDRRGCRQQG